MNLSSNKRLGLLALLVLGLDQATKAAVLKCLDYPGEKPIIDGFFSLVHWRNTGAAWSMFHGKNGLLAIVALAALLVLYLSRHRFYIKTRMGELALGLMFGGIIGNLVDRLLRGHVIDFLYFYVRRSSAGGGPTELGFPAFNVADSAICVGVALLFILSLQKEQTETAPTPAGARPPQSTEPATRS